MKKIIILSSIIIFFGLVFWFGKSGMRDTSKPTSQKEKVNVQLKFFHQAQFAGMYVAKEKGMYAAQGVDVSFIPFENDTKPVDMLTSGKAKFAVIGADELISARLQGSKIRAIAVIYRISPVCAYSLTSSNIKKPQEFIGKKVGLAPLENIKMMYGIAMKQIGIDRKKIIETPQGFDASELLAGKVDIATGFITNEPYQVKKAGKEATTFLLADYGASFYNDVIVTTEDMIASNPTLVHNFLEATIKGWKYAIEKPEEAVSETMKYTTDQDREKQTYMLTTSIPLINPGSIEIGKMKVEDWNKLIIAMSASVVAQEVYDDTFIENIHK